MLHYRLHTDPKSSHRQIAHILLRLRRDPILDVGAAQGFLGRLLDGSGLLVDAIEPNMEWAQHAAPFYRNVWPLPVEATPLPARTYRMIICADVLEHTVDPVATLRHLRDAATDDALFVISLPNVAHIAVRGLLLFGQFPRMERGILDRTHLHFWTRRTARALLSEAGLETLRVRGTAFPIEEVWPGGRGNLIYNTLVRLQHLALLVAPALFAWQWIFVARRRRDEAVERGSPAV